MVEQQRTEEISQSWNRLLAGKYEVTGEISRGAFGQILRVRQTGLDKVFAAKILAADAANQEAFKRLAREGQILTRLSHPNIVKVYSAAIDEDAGFIVLMDYLDGQPLSQVIKDKKLTIRSAVDIGRQVCAGLQYAHESGILHRDLKPSNVMIVRNQERHQAILIDFGIAKVQDASQKLTQTGAILGTPLYMSPEQLMGLPLDARSDVYSFGCVLYEMLTGQPPFPGENWMELAAKHHSEAVVPPSQYNRDLPFDLEQIVLTCMAKKPEKRYQSIADIIKALDSIDYNIPARQSSLMERRLRAIGRAAVRPAIVCGAALLLAGPIWIVLQAAVNRINLNDVAQLIDYRGQETEIGRLINENHLADAQSHLEKLIAKINVQSAEAAELPTLHMLLARTYRLQGDYRQALNQVELAVLFKDRFPLPAFLPIEKGLACYGDDKFQQAIGALDTKRNDIVDPQARLEAWRWRAKAFFFKPELRPSDKWRRYSDGNGEAEKVIIAMKEHKNNFTDEESRSLLECAVLSAMVLNRQAHFVSFGDHNENWGSADTLAFADHMIHHLTPEKTPPVWLACTEEAKAEAAVGLGQPELAGRHLDEMERSLGRIKPGINKFEEHEIRLWTGCLRQRLKELHWQAPLYGGQPAKTQYRFPSIDDDDH